jgi:enediyne biosynthesis protein E4
MKTRLCSALCLALASVGTLLAQPAYFTRITDGPIATDANTSWGCSLVDYDNDGLADVFVANWRGDTNSLYHNEGNFQFSKVLIGLPVESDAGVWGDWDNDGDLDLFVSNVQPYKSYFFRNDLAETGHSAFTQITSGTWVNTAATSVGAAWGDYDNDGFLDLAVANASSSSQNDFLYRNDGAGGMISVNAPPLTSSGGRSQNCPWADYDGDGDLDLYVTNSDGQRNFLFRNEGGGTFTRVVTGPEVTTTGEWIAAAWADYDNDGDLDLFASRCCGQANALYQNNGDGTFTAVADDPVVTSVRDSGGVAWGDFDNDGYLDLFVGNFVRDPDFLFHNERDGSFTRIYDGDIVNDTSYAGGCAWADLDNDGFLDLFVANQNDDMNVGETNFLYRNDAKANGNTNGWLLVRLAGTASNRSAIGAKVRVKATLWGNEVWQLREISGGSGFCSQNDLRAHFGLGDAARVDLLRIEWPSGIVQTLSNVAPNQILTITEHQAGVTNAPTLAASKSVNSKVLLIATGQTDLRYVFEASTNLLQWKKISVRTNLTGTAEFTDNAPNNISKRFYRVLVP